MKTILVLTDFSINADSVAQYALRLAQKIEANLLLCNIYQLPDDDDAHQNPWPIKDCEKSVINNLGAQVAMLKTLLDKETGDSFKPDIEQCSQQGLIADALNKVATRHHIFMAVIGAHHATGFFGNNNAWDIIENADFPVLVVPYQVRFKPFKQIAFATMMNYTDITVLESLAGLAKHSDSQILIVNITPDEKEASIIKEFFNQIPHEIDYPNITYQHIKRSDVVSCLKELNANTDLLVMVHRRRSYLQDFFSGSTTRKLTLNGDKPILIFPCSEVMETIPVF
jgi:nucleotide-binding universal stress UspA family protein